MDHQQYMLPSSFPARYNNPNRFWSPTVYIDRVSRANLDEFAGNSLPPISTVHEYENRSKQPMVHRNVNGFSRNRITPFTRTTNDQYYQPSYQPNVQPTNVEFDTNNWKSAPRVRPFTQSEVLKIVLITIGCFLGLCIVPAAIAVPIILKTSTSSSDTSDVPTGTVLLYTGSSLSLPEPTDRWLLCNGSAVSRITYSNLFAVIGITFGSGNGINTFNLPDFRSRFPMGSNGDTLNTGGNSTYNLTESELPAHTHDHGSLQTDTVPAHTHVVTDPGHDHGGSTGTVGSYVQFVGTGNIIFASGGSFTFNNHAHTISTDITGISLQAAGSHTHTVNGTTGSAGLGQPINIVPSYQTVHYIIRT